MVKEWEREKIGNLLDFKNGLNKGKQFFGYGTPIVNYTDVYKKRGLKKEDIKGKVSLDDSELSRYAVKKGDVFFTRTSETPEEVGIASVLLEDIPDCAFSGFVLRGRPKTDRLVPEYCKYCFSTEEVRREIITRCTYTTRALTNGKQLSAIDIPVPEKFEQKEISNVLTDLDDLISNLQALLAKKESIRDGSIQALITGKKRLPGFYNDFQVGKVGDVVKVMHGRSQHEIEDENGKYPILGTGGIIGMANTYLYNEPSVLIGRKGTIDKPQFMDEPFWTIDTLFYTKIRESCVPRYVYYLFKTIDWYKYNEASGVPSLNAATIEGISIEYPAYDEQKAIVDIISDMDDEIKDLELKYRKYKYMRIGVMDQLLTGKIRLV